MATLKVTQVKSTIAFNKNQAVVLKSLGLRTRGLYCGRHTYISIAVSVREANIARVAAYCGTSVRRIEANYLRWLTDLTDPTAPEGDRFVQL